MKIRVVTNYVVACDHPYAKDRIEIYHKTAERFAASYREHTPTTQLDGFIVVANGGPLPDRAKSLYDGLVTDVLEYHGDGWWEGEMIEAARANQDADLLVFLLSTLHFSRKGWLERILAAQEKHGQGLFGAMGNYEHTQILRSCMVATLPKLLLSYPWPVDDFTSAHHFEHGIERSFTKHVIDSGYPAVMVCWDGTYGRDEWRKPANIFRRGNQSNVIAWDHHCDIYMTSTPERQQELRNWADGKLNTPGSSGVPPDPAKEKA